MGAVSAGSLEKSHIALLKRLLDQFDDWLPNHRYLV
jgi:hypothetical protein